MKAIRVMTKEVRVKQNQERAIHCHGCDKGTLPSAMTSHCVMCNFPDNDNVAQLIDGNDECRDCGTFVVHWNVEAMRRHILDCERGRV